MCIFLFIAAIALPLLLVVIIGSSGQTDITGLMLLGLYVEVAFVSSVLLWYIRNPKDKKHTEAKDTETD